MGLDETPNGRDATAGSGIYFPETMRSLGAPLMRSVVLLALAALLVGAVPAGAEPTELAAAEPAAEGLPAPVVPPALEPDPAEVADDYDPWQPFNERMFSFNHDVLDRFVLKPTATAWDSALPDVAQRSLSRAFANLEMPRRVVNNLLQARPLSACEEVARFVVNTTAGVVGLIDVAKLVHLEKCDADMGQTLGLYGFGAGPYLVLPFLPPLTVRDGIGRGIDGALDPFGFFIPFVAGTAMGVVNVVNERSLNLKLFADVEESVLDLYSAVRNGYLQRRRRFVEEARGEPASPPRMVAMPDASPVEEDPT